MFRIERVAENHWDFWRTLDKHTTREGFSRKVEDRLGYVIYDDDTPVGLMHYVLWWDNLPFLNLIYFVEKSRRRGFGKQAMAFWEDDMRARGYRMVLISTQVDEDSQFFYRKIGYTDCGGVVLNGPPMEMFMRKTLAPATEGENNG